MGKSKQSQRTKNNVRPSSSGRSALLLNSGQFELGVSNVGSSELPALFPTLVVPSIDPLVSPELQMCLKKLNKKDPITKTKALQELTELVASSNVDDVVAALPSWAHFYKILTADPDRKVRECTQICHGSVMSVCGRRAAPYLRQLVPAWLQAQHDDHAPAQAQAALSLAKTFPENKLPEVISFCKEEVMTHLIDNLLGPGEANYIKKTDDAELARASAARVGAGSLHALRALVSRLPAAPADWLWGRLATLLAHAAFWARAHHTDDTVRVAWYGAAGALAERFGAQFGERYGQKMLRVMLAANENNSVVAAKLWDSLLLFMYNVKDWHKYLDKKELLIKRILEMLENGGWGSARALCGALLPLLARLDPDFYAAFFDAMLAGLLKKSILNSKSERQSWIASLEECLRYVSTRRHEGTLEIVSRVQRRWLEAALEAALDPARDVTAGRHLVECSAARMAGLLEHWLRQTADGDRYDQMIRNFWLNVGAVAVSQIDRVPLERDRIGRLIDGHVVLLLALKTSFGREAEPRRSIRFDDEPRTVAVEPAREPIPRDPSVAERYRHNLNDVVHRVCCRYFELANEAQISEPVLAPLMTLLERFDGEGLFEAISAHFGCGSPYEWYERVAAGWLAGDAMRCEPAVDIVFMLAERLAEVERNALFDSFERLPPAALESCLSRCLSGAVRGAGAWLRGPGARGAVRAACGRLLRGEGGAERLLLRALRPRDRGDGADGADGAVGADGAECAVGAQTGELAARQVCAALERGEAAAAAAGACARVLAALAARPPAPALRPSIALRLFALLVEHEAESSSLPADTRAAAHAACARCVREATPAERAELRRAAAALVRRHLPLDGSGLDVPGTERVTSLCPALVPHTGEYAAEAAALAALLLALAPADCSPVEPHALRHDLVAGRLWSPAECGAAPELTRADFVRYAQRCVFRALCLHALLLRGAPAQCDALLARDSPLRELCRALYDRTVVAAVYRAYGFWLHYSLIEETKTKIDAILEAIIQECGATTRRRILEALSALADTHGFYWAYARTYFQTQCNKRIIIHETDSRSSDTHQRGEHDYEKCEQKKEIDEKSEQAKESREKSEQEKESREKSEQEKESREKSEQEKESSEKSDKEKESSEKSEKENSNEQSQQESTEESEDIDEESEKERARREIEINNMINSYVEKLSEIKIEDIVKDHGFFHSLQACTLHAAESERGVLRARYCVLLRALLAHRPHALHATGARRALHRLHRDLIVDAYYADNDVMLYEVDVSASAWAAVACSAAAADYLSALVASSGWTLPAHCWDFITITLCSLLTSIEKSKRNWTSTKVSMLARAALHLFAVVARFVRAVRARGERAGRAGRARCERAPPAPHVAQLPREWDDIFAPDLHHSLFSIILYILESSPKSAVTSNHVAVLNELLACARHIRWAALSAPHRRQLAPQRIQDAGAAALLEPAPLPYKLLAAAALQLAGEPLVLDDAARVSSRGEESERPALSLARYGPACAALRDRLRAPLAHLKVCEETCELEEGSELCSLMLGWLLLVQVMYSQWKLARGDLVYHYIELYREHKWTQPVLEAALRVLPPELLASAAAAPDAALPGVEDMFYAPPCTQLYQCRESATVYVLACGALRACVVGAGSGDTRGWLGAGVHRQARVLETLAKLYISPRAIREELQMVLRRANEIEDAEVCVHWSLNEASCALLLEERVVELRIALSPSHPLAPPRAEASGAAIAADTNWLRMYMTYQNGSCLNALKMWCDSVTRKLERSKQCYICYCRLHFRSGKLPRAHCRQCRNKFHSACLRKWFKTSNKTHCPICRTPF